MREKHLVVVPHRMSQRSKQSVLAILNKKNRKQQQGHLRHKVDGNDLFSRAVSSQISSTCESLTVVFGMGTSGSSQL